MSVESGCSRCAAWTSTRAAPCALTSNAGCPCVASHVVERGERGAAGAGVAPADGLLADGAGLAAGVPPSLAGGGAVACGWPDRAARTRVGPARAARYPLITAR